MIVLDMKIVDIDLADFLVGHIMTKVSCDWLPAAVPASDWLQAVALSVQTKIRIVSSDFAMAAALQTSLARAGYSINIVARHGSPSADSCILFPTFVNRTDDVKRCCC